VGGGGVVGRLSGSGGLTARVGIIDADVIAESILEHLDLALNHLHPRHHIKYLTTA